MSRERLEIRFGSNARVEKMDKGQSEELRQQVAQHVAEFLARGGKIQQIPSGYAGLPRVNEVRCNATYMTAPGEFVRGIL